MTQPKLDWQPSPNFTKGRAGTPVRKLTFHHVVGTAESAVSKFKNSASATSSHFVVSPTKIYCCVDTDNTAWTNGVWASNLESVTIEHAGDWRNGYYNQGVIDQSAILVAWLRSLYPQATFNRHRDIKATACPGDLPVELIWNKATEILNPPKPPAPPVAPAPTLNIVDIQNKFVTTNKDANLWDLNFKTYAEAKSVKVLPKGTEIEVSATAKHPLGSTYYMTEYSYSKGIMNGINVADCLDKVVTPPVTPPEPPKPTVEELQAQINALIEKLQNKTVELSKAHAQILGLTQTVKEKQAEIDTLIDKNVELADENKELKAQLATVGDDTELLNSFGQLLRKLIERLGLK